ncbi:LysR family transcriptional regulator [Rhizobium sp. FKL33]|uniref:LysR family transcriptional regulator n=1 Tax=Rhizobium sp. FKL33 TaxID=2562307 RepID=UPI001FEEFEAE|nr:LysR family transcriptional regulator [Rhizobium sp. FKL33]
MLGVHFPGGNELDSLFSLKTFLAVAELRSFSTAARRLEISPAMVSKHIMRLEKRLGSRLLNRNSRNVSLTEAGQRYFDRVRPLLEGLEEIETELGATTQTPRGTLRLSAPIWMANARFAGILSAYRHLYPEVKLDIELNGRLVDLVEEGYDLAIRVARALEKDVVGRKLIDMRFVLVATRALLERISVPTSLADLDGAPFLSYTPVMPTGQLKLQTGGEERIIRFEPVMRSANETLIHAACLEGMGITILPRWQLDEDLKTGNLVEILPGDVDLAVPLYAIYPNRAYLSAKVRTFLDFLAAENRLR